MKVFLVEYFTDEEVGTMHGEPTQDTCLAHIAYCREDALNWIKANADWSSASPGWHWYITPRSVGKDEYCAGPGKHFTHDGIPCRHNGTIEDPCSAPKDDEECVCINPWDEEEDKDVFDDLNTDDTSLGAFADIANKLADRLDEMFDIVGALAEDLRNEFPKK